jgi:hypothetical protein
VLLWLLLFSRCSNIAKTSPAVKTVSGSICDKGSGSVAFVVAVLLKEILQKLVTIL